MSAGDIPAFAELPALGDTGERHAWEVFGAGDELGCLNFIGPPAVAAAAAEVRSGEVINLNLPLDEPQPQFWAGRGLLRHHRVNKGNTRDDYIDGFELQGSTQWDGLRHQRFRQYGFYGGRQDQQLDAGELGIDAWARRGVVGRGVLVDVAGHLAAAGSPLAPQERFPIGPALLETVLAAQQTEPRAGDILLLRTGWLGWYRGVPRAERDAMAERLDADRSQIALPGLDPRRDTAAWLWDHRIAALAADNPTVETLPYRPEEGWAHIRLIPLLGLPIGELWVLDELAAACRRAARFTFMLTAAPLNLPGGAGSPANAYAIL
jgi:kynurenine formamidase